MTGSGVLLGTVLFIYQLPFIILSLPIGVLADRINRKTLLMASQFAMALIALALAIDIALGRVQPWHLMVFAFLSGTENTLIHIVRQALVPRVVPAGSLLNAIALNTIGFNISRIVAPGLGGFLIVAIGVAGNFGIQAFLLLGVAFASLPISVGKAITNEPLPPVTPRAFIGEMFSTITYVWTRPLLRMLFIVQYVTLFFAVPFLNFMPVWSSEILKGDADTLGLLYVVSGLGAIAGTFLIARKSNLSRPGNWLLVSVLANAVFLIIFSQATNYIASVGLLTILGAIQIVFFALNMSSVQSIIPDIVQGKVVALYNLGHGMIALGSLTMGLLIGYWGIQSAILFMNIPLLALAAVALVWMRPVRQM